VTAWIAGWRLALRIAGREAWRAKGRSILVLVMIALPVLAVSSADILIRTSQISAAEGLDRYLGQTAALRVDATAETGLEQMSTDPFGDTNYGSNGDAGTPASLAQIEQIVGQRPSTPMTTVSLTVSTTAGRAAADGYELDPTDPLARGLARLTSGRWPAKPGEVAINGYLAGRGLQVGQHVTAYGRQGKHTTKVSETVVGIMEVPVERDASAVLAVPGALPYEYVGHDGYLLGGGDVTWSQVLALNKIGVLGLSRYVVHHPPDLSALVGNSRPVPPAVIAIAALIVVMALLEVILLAGPSFAVGAKRQARSLALMAASGSTPVQARRVILAGGVVLGLVGAGGGLLLSIPVARLLTPAAQRYSPDQWLGPFEVRWHEVLLIAAFGLASAVLAAIVPATIASRQDVVAVLAGRRADRRPGLRSPILGLVLIGLGIASAASGTHQVGSSGGVMIAASALLCVLGMLFLVPVIVVGIARLGARLPLALRFAVRDAARHRTRTVPAVAAVAATVAGVITLGIAISSQQAQDQAQYLPQLPLGVGQVTASTAVSWPQIEEHLRGAVPGIDLHEVEAAMPTKQQHYLAAVVHDAAGQRVDASVTSSLGSQGRTQVAVSDGSGLLLPGEVAAPVLAAARTTLAHGGVVVFTDAPRPAGTVSVRLRGNDSAPSPTATLPATYVSIKGAYPPGQIVLSPQAAARLGVTDIEPVDLQITSALSSAQQATAQEALNTLPGTPSLYVERGYRPDSTTRIIELVLGALGALLMLGGTVTATALSLTDARPDLATLAAVGAAPRTRRWVGAGYALGIGVVGAVLGAAVGFVPGIAITYPLTGDDWAPPGEERTAHFLAVPWLLLVVVVIGLPLLVSAVVAATTRGRLPMVARLQ
jgi:putative ABC transport system permease protein